MIRSIGMAAAFALSVATVACGYETEENIESISSIEQDILDGTVVVNNGFGVVALYHKDGNQWFPRPCSGRVAAVRGDVKIVVTAKHCINDGTTELPLDAMRITAHRSPGPSVPDFAKTPFRAERHPSKDIALLWVSGDIQLPDTLNNVGMNVVPTQQWIGTGLLQLGYGWGVDGDNSSTGVLRSGAFYPVTSADAASATYRYDNNPTISGGEVTHGDSGGPSIKQSAIGPSPSDWSVATVQLGVHWVEGGDTAIAETWDNFLSPRLGYIYVRSIAETDRRIAASAQIAGNQLRAVTNIAAARNRFRYTIASQRLELRTANGGATNLCMAVKDNTNAVNQPIVLAACNAQTSGQRFEMTVNAQLKVPAFGRCVKKNSADSLVLANCSTEASQRWIVDPNPGT